MFKSILVKLTTSNDSNALLLQQALVIAESSQSNLILARVIGSEDSNHKQFTDPFEWRLQRAEAENAVNNLCKQLAFRGVKSTPCFYDTWDVNVLNEEVQRRDVDLIITKKTRDGINNSLHDLLKMTAVPVLIVPEVISPIKRILVPLDGSVRSECALPVINMLSQNWNCNVLLFHAMELPHSIYEHNQTEDDRSVLETLVSSSVEKTESYLQGVANQFDANSEVIVTDKMSSIHTMIEDKQIDLIVLSAHGENGQPQWPYGSTTHNIVAYAKIPVLIVQDMPAIMDNPSIDKLRQPRKRVAAI